MAQSYSCWLVHGLFPYFHVGFDLTIDPWQGGGIAAGFATKYPEMVDEKLILLSPTGLLKVGSDFHGVYSIHWQIFLIGFRRTNRSARALEWSCWTRSFDGTCSSMVLSQGFGFYALRDEFAVASAKTNAKIYT